MAFYRILVFSSALSWSPLAVRGQGQGNTTCKGTSLDWYTSVVGETPCQTYQSLRRICAPNYTTRGFPIDPLGIGCNDPGDRQCCCNSIAFGLGMLCINCQQGTGTDVLPDQGINGAPGAYETYLFGCAPITNQSLPSNVQQTVCNNELKIDDDMYGIFWPNGQWIYEEARSQIQAGFTAKANNTFSAHCNTTTPTPTPKHSSISGGAIGGIAVAAIAGLAFAGFIIWFFLRRHRAAVDMIQPTNSRNMGEMDRQIDPFYPQPSDVTAALMSDAPISSTPPPPTTRRVGPEKGTVVMGWNRGSSDVGASSTISTSAPTVEPTPPEPERHLDAGQLGRSPSGRLPPAYGEQVL
ncbi:hypothetical protein FIBSPDRAFT_1038478 [Athelia psychrophila]|uniref:Mid2 domain-containing protein n=1 Tax=Athelia psychrophila TaxID=1759441 RepID=A0A166T347_9AGAM|nr:hypothetical protein FIBSPDRAFT_1038478 [Fibularhizoctonia sp. CBS 109695]